MQIWQGSHDKCISVFNFKSILNILLKEKYLKATVGREPAVKVPDCSSQLCV